MKFERRFTDDRPVAEQIEWITRPSKIVAADGSIVFTMDAVEVPAHWSQTATDILAQKYLRKAGVPSEVSNGGVYRAGGDTSMPTWLMPNVPLNQATFGPETSAKQVFHRLAGCWTYWGWREGMFAKWQEAINGPANEPKQSARVFYDELYWMLAMQFGAPNSPQWFNTGLHWAYGIEGPDSGQWTVNHDLIDAMQVTKDDYYNDKHRFYQIGNSYERPQPHACFIQPVRDDLVNEGGIMDLWTREVRLFKHGSGTGTNFSSIRAKNEKLSGGGVSSGLMSFLDIGDRAAGSIKSGGVTRRAAKMVCLDLDHPEIEEFIDWKAREERKALAMNVGSEILSRDDDGEVYSFGELEGEALRTVSGQNSNNSVRVTDAFLRAVDEDADWHLTARTTGEVMKTVKARDLWHKICRAAWASADPGVQFHDTINRWHTCVADGPINASNPCGEYNFLDNTACNLASLNLVKFLFYLDDGVFNTDAFEHAVRLWTVVLEISVYMASFPSRDIAEGSYNYRTLGLGYANLGGLLMRMALPYDSDEGREVAASVTALMHAVACMTSDEMAHELQTFPYWSANAEEMQSVMDRHGFALGSLTVNPISSAATRVWNKMHHDGFRNAQVTLIAPTGTIALLMDCDTTGIEPDFSLVKHKSLAGGGTMKIVNQSVAVALKRLGYSQLETELELTNIEATGTIGDPRTKIYVKSEHFAVFDCAVPAFEGGRCLDPMAHVRMVAAVQPFLSGGVSKTVNLPHDATVDDVDRVYREAHKLGLKSIAIYRDGSKLTQPLRVSGEDGASQRTVNPSAIMATEGSNPSSPTNGRGTREPLPNRRGGYTQKLRINGQSLYLTTGEYPDGTLGEIFVSLAREGSTVRSLMESFSKAVSIGIQYGVPLSEYVDAFLHTRFEPAGPVQGHDRVKMCSSIVDLIFRDLAVGYLGRDELAHVGSGTVPAGSNANDTTYSKAEGWTDQQIKDFETAFEKTDSGKLQFIPRQTTSDGLAVVPLRSSDAVLLTPVATGDVCWVCGNATLVRTGTCVTCETCGVNSGCG